MAKKETVKKETNKTSTTTKKVSTPAKKAAPKKTQTKSTAKKPAPKKEAAKKTTSTKKVATSKKTDTKTKLLFLEYPKCSTCKKARKFLEDNKIDFEARDIVLKNPTAAELKKWKKKTDKPLKRFFNTSGNAYREMNLKDVLKETDESEWYDILAKDGMLVKRPLLIADDYILIGFKEDEWEEKLLKN